MLSVTARLEKLGALAVFWWAVAVHILKAVNNIPRLKIRTTNTKEKKVRQEPASEERTRITLDLSQPGYERLRRLAELEGVSAATNLAAIGCSPTSSYQSEPQTAAGPG
jgi:hypothetical protein